MGESHSGRELAAKFTAAAFAMGKANRTAITAATQVYKDKVLEEAADAVGGDRKLSRFGWTGSGYRGVRLGAGYDVKGYDRATARLRARPQGPWKVVEYGARPHIITPGRAALSVRHGAALTAAMSGGAIGAKRRRGRKARVLSFGPDQVAAYASHPGTRGKLPWQKGIRRGTQPAMTTFRTVHRNSLMRTFR